MFYKTNPKTALHTIKDLNQEIKKSSSIIEVINERYSNNNKREHEKLIIFSYAGHDTAETYTFLIYELLEIYYREKLLK